MKELLKQCGINKHNLGSCVGGIDWISTNNAGENISYCPSNKSVIATVFEANTLHKKCSFFFPLKVFVEKQQAVFEKKSKSKKN